MPRPRVRPEDRRRSIRACEACRLSRKRCDSQLPCALCADKGLGAQCHYRQSSSHSASTPILPHPQRHNADAPLSPRKTPEQVEGLLHIPYTQKGRMLLSSNGEKVYVGNTAAISMLEFLRNTMRRHAGPSPFTESRQRHMMLEVGVRRSLDTEKTEAKFADYLDGSERFILVQLFRAVSNGLLCIDIDGIFDHGEFADREDTVSRNTMSQDDIAAVYFMIAIGAQCRGKDEEDFKCSVAYFAEAQRLSFSGMLLDPSIAMVRNFLLMAFYMFCVCRRNTAMMYLGVSSRAATILGLHLPEVDVAIPAKIRSMRTQTWKSLRVLDLLCNAILGRPTAIPGIRPGSHHGDELPYTDSTQRILTLHANFEACSIIEAISQQLIQNNAMNISMAENFLEQLRNWAQAMPEELRQSITGGSHSFQNQNHQASCIGKIHVACCYYYGVMLTTRQFLVTEAIALLQPQQSNQESQRHEATGSASLHVNEKLLQLSRVCVSAAAYLTQICFDAGNSDLLPGNMCILQAWVFAAGLVLGLSTFVQPDALGCDVQLRLASSRGVLARLSRLSPQAGRYLDILTDFAEAIESYHLKRQQGQEPPSTGLLLERILKPVDVVSNDNAEAAQQRLQSVSKSRESAAHQAIDELENPLDGMLWSQMASAMFSPSITDEVGFQLLWDDYVPPVEMDDAILGDDFSATL